MTEAPAEPELRAEPAGLLVKLARSAPGRFAPGLEPFADRGELILELDGPQAGPALAGSGAAWVRMPASASPWDEVHALAARGFGLDGAGLLAAEPDWALTGLPLPASGTAAGQGDRQRWHLEDGFSGLGSARTAVGKAEQKRIRIAHLDTGYDPGHKTVPAGLDRAGARSLVERDPDRSSAEDRVRPGLPAVTARGHGTATLAILASAAYGGAPHAQVVPIRVSDGVVIFRTSAIVGGIRHAIEQQCDVLSMSLGGLASAAMADAVNLAYRRGLLMVTAAGNNFEGAPIPTIVYPARFRRVVAACGVMKDGRAYANLGPLKMAGCHGPPAKMATALAAFTPCMPWARIGSGDGEDRDGGGTSSATPQIAAAAALWMARHRAELAALPEAWMRVEAARRALFRSARAPAGGRPHPMLGMGVLDANALLKLRPGELGPLTPEKPADASFALLKLLSGRGVGLTGVQLVADELLELELVQLVQRDPALEAALGGDPEAGVAAEAAAAAMAMVADHPLASATLRAVAGRAAAGGDSGRRGPPPAVPPPDPPLPPGPPAAVGIGGAAASGPVPPPEPAFRRLRIFARDPSLAATLADFEASVATVEVANERALKPGPVGDYLEVVDVDPASNLAYPPVDLRSPAAMLGDGLAPSEGNPAFHQQMVYAVGMRTIAAFEEALGRRMLWAGRQHFVPRLRVYPHALREANAYYSPDRLALLFGYFPSRRPGPDGTPDGGIVFTCLSADIIAHEMTHALLDGQAPAMRDPSNPDVLAFHEAFADIVALFQQFGIESLLAREVAATRGRLDMSMLFGGLARQFGEGTGRGRPLRTYPDLPAGIAYGTTTAPHDLGQILVAAVYRAFLSIAARRTEALVRLASGGSGRLPDGHYHPDLVTAIAQAVARAADDSLRMCIRAIDYLPPNDVTFGDYLRAIVTADADAWPEDRSGYRVAFLESFRHYGLLPRNLRTVSTEALRWQGPEEPGPAWLAPIVTELDVQPGPLPDRAEQHRRGRRAVLLLQRRLRTLLDEDEDGALHALIGLQPGLGRFDEEGRPLAWAGRTNFYIDALHLQRRAINERAGLQGDRYQAIVRIRQRRPERLDPQDDGSPQFWFRGGATLIVEPWGETGRPALRYVIRQSMASAGRLARERQWRRTGRVDPLRAAYFGQSLGLTGLRGPDEPFRLLHARHEED